MDGPVGMSSTPVSVSVVSVTPIFTKFKVASKRMRACASFLEKTVLKYRLCVMKHRICIVKYLIFLLITREDGSGIIGDIIKEDPKKDGLRMEHTGET